MMIMILVQITKIENLPENLQELHLDNNQIMKIENLPNSLRYMNISSNLITELPLSLLELNHLYKLYCNNNPIENINPLVEQWLRRLDIMYSYEPYY
jgi:Leucine-rich repeat (LRR) protein